MPRTVPRLTVKGVIDLDDAFTWNERCQLLGAKHALQITTVIANGFALQQSQTFDGRIMNVEPIAHI